MEVTQIILIVFIVLLVIAYPILVSTRNKKENQKMQEQTNSLKRGDKVLTTSGVYGTIVDLVMEADKKIVTIETGSGKNKGYLSVDAYAIYNVFRDEPAKPEEKKLEETTEKQVNKSSKKESSDVAAVEAAPMQEATSVETTSNIERKLIKLRLPFTKKK